MFESARADELFRLALEQGLASQRTAGDPRYPWYLWVYDEEHELVFEAIYGGAVAGCYHGYPIRRSDPFFNDVVKEWGRNE